MSAETYEQREEREATEARDKQTRLKTLAAQIPAHLPGWTFEERPRTWNPERTGFYLVQIDGLGLIEVKGGGYQQENRIVIDPEWNGLSNHKPWDSRLKDITVSPDKTPAQIARDIQRRLLPAYLPLLAQAAERKAASDDRDARTLANAEAFCAATGATLNKDHDGNLAQNGNIWLDTLHWWGGDFHITDENAVSLPRFGTTAAKAAKIIKILLEE